MVAVAELPQVVDRLTSEVSSGEGPTVEFAVDLSQGVSDQGAEVVGLGHWFRLN